jgi:hypothetical protein
MAVLPIPFIIGELLAIYSTDAVNPNKKWIKKNHLGSFYYKIIILL